MDKPEQETTKKVSSQASVILPTFCELFKSTAIHGALMGNLLNIREDLLSYKSEDDSLVQIVTQLITYSRDTIKVYNIEQKSDSSKTPGKKANSLRVSLTHEIPLFGEIQKVGIIYHPEDGNKGYLVVLFSDHKIFLEEDNRATSKSRYCELINSTDVSVSNYFDLSVEKTGLLIYLLGILMYRHVLTLLLTSTFYQTLDIDLSKDIPVLPNYASLNKETNTATPFYGMTYYFNLIDYNMHNPIDFEIVEHKKELRIYILNLHTPVHRSPTPSKSNLCELVGFKINKKFFNTALWEKNKIRSVPKENIEIYDCCIKFKFLPSNCFKVLCLRRGGFLILSPFAIYYFDIVNEKDEWVGFLVNQQYANTEDYRNLYYKCGIINGKPESQINLKNYRFEIIDSRNILLVGVGAFLLRLDLRKEGLVENMELFKIPELADHRMSFITVNTKPQRPNHYTIFTGSFMSNGHLLEMEILTDPRLDLQLAKKARLNDERPEGNLQQIEDIFHSIHKRDMIETTAPINDLATPKASSSNAFQLIASCSYGIDSSLLFIKSRIELEPTDIYEVDNNIQGVFSVKNPEDSKSSSTKYLLLSKQDQTEVLMCEDVQLIKPKPEEILFITANSTFQTKRLKIPDQSIIIQISGNCIRFINYNTKEVHDVPMGEALDVKLKGFTLGVLKTQRMLEVYTFSIPADGSITETQFVQRRFQVVEEKEVTCFAFLKRRRYFPQGLQEQNRNDMILAVAYENHSIKLFRVPEDSDEEVQLFFHCPYVNEGISNLLNVIDEDEKRSSTLLGRSVTSSSIANPTGISMKPSCPYVIEEIYLKELHQSLLLIVRISNGEYYLYKSYTNEFNSRYVLGYSLDFQRLLHNLPLFKFPKDKPPKVEAPAEKSEIAEETEAAPIKPPIKTIFKHHYRNQKDCICICSEEIYIWLFYKRDELFIHSIRKDPSNALTTLCDFNIPDHPNLFVSRVNNKLNAYNLNDHSLDYEAPLPLKRIYIEATVRNLLIFPAEDPRYVLFVSSQRNIIDEQFSINLIEMKSLDSFNDQAKPVKPIKTINIDKGIKITKMRTVQLNINGAMITLVAVICFMLKSPESYSHVGKVSLYNIEKNELNLLHEIYFDNFPVTDVFAINGFLFVCKGYVIEWQKILMREDRTFHNEIISFLFTEKFLIMETTVLPNFLICSDIRRSLSIFYWRAENPIKLEPKGASFKTHTLYASEFFDSLSDNLRVMIADDQKNINLISFSVTTQKMEKAADFYVGALVTNFKKHRSIHKSHDTLLISTNEGGVGFIGTYDSSHRSLVTLQNLLAIEFPFVAGLHPKSYRLYHTNDFNVKIKPKKNFLDGKLLIFYCYLPYTMQNKIAKKLKESRENLLNLIYTLFSANNVF